MAPTIDLEAGTTETECGVATEGLCEEQHEESSVFVEFGPNAVNVDAVYASIASLFSKIDEAMVRAMIFSSIEDAQKFIKAYASITGFSVRIRSTKKGKLGHPIKNREWVCNREGFREEYSGKDRKREETPETRCGCKASFRVAHDRFTDTYVVTRFDSSHNHPLEDQVRRKISPSDKSLLALFTEVGFRPCQILDYLELLAGGAGNLSFKRKDAYNLLYKLRMQKVRGGDVKAVLNLFENMKEQDTDFVYKYEIDEQGALTHLFWSDGMSRAEYEQFGDVVVFDSTYKTNQYRFPLILFSGVNNHRSTCIFGGAIMFNETIRSYKWLLKTFLETMKGKVPIGVLTDQDASMKAAIQTEFPGACHRLCSWHLARNCRQKVHVKNFTSDFLELLRRRCSEDEFELSWLNLVEAYDVADDEWVMELYEKRKLWGEAFFRGKFMTRMTTTQRAESMNALVKLSIDQNMTLIDFMNHFFRTIRRIRSDFLVDQEESEKINHTLKDSPLQSLEKHASTICTRANFRLLRYQIKHEQSLICESNVRLSANSWVLTFGEYESEDSFKHTVVIDDDVGIYNCDCLMIESEGLPCTHLISALKVLRKKQFPENCIHPRWLIESGKKLVDKFPNPISALNSQNLWCAEMNRECVNLTSISGMLQSGKSAYVDEIRRLANEAETAVATQLANNIDVQSMEPANENNRGVAYDLINNIDEVNVDNSLKNINNVLDPTPIRSKGGHKVRQQKCSLCSERGHKANTCVRNALATGNRKRKKELMHIRLKMIVQLEKL